MKTTYDEKEQLHEQVASLGGHTNHKQKIHIMANYRKRQTQLEEVSFDNMVTIDVVQYIS